MKLEITNAKSEDSEGIQKVFYETWIATYPNEQYGITLDNLKYRWQDMLSPKAITNLKELISTLDDNFRFLVAKADDKVVGASFLEKNEDHNRLQSVYILPEYQGQGIGRKIWEEAKTFFDLTKDTVVDVAIYNTKAIDYYKKLGFIDTGKRFDEDRNKDPKVVMRPMMEMRLMGIK
jgi:ribosomal protein S18 acetylase RimI-like enzyme